MSYKTDAHEVTEITAEFQSLLLPSIRNYTNGRQSTGVIRMAGAMRPSVSPVVLLRDWWQDRNRPSTGIIRRRGRRGRTRKENG